MTYKSLYEHCQTLKPKISRKIILPKVLELTGRDKIRIAKTGKLDPKICRGLFLSSGSVKHPFGQGDVILLARDQTYCWERLVCVKELMHLFDKADEKTSTADAFEKLLMELSLSVPSSDKSLQWKSESKAVWRALAVLCPEKERLELLKQMEGGLIDSYGVAVKLRIPEKYIPHLFTSNFKTIVDGYLD